jgi:hypothetical protein
VVVVGAVSIEELGELVTAGAEAHGVPKRYAARSQFTYDLGEVDL